LVPSKVHYMEKNPGMFSSKTSFLFDRRMNDMDIVDDMGVSKLSAKVFLFFFLSELLL